ncbi:MAG: efflux RND transporter periplasmic adaptor subunit [Pseudomonadota bacterium]
MRLGTVDIKPFAETLPVNGVLVPRNTVFVDAVKGGSVVEILVEDGAIVSAGEVLARMTNTELELQVMAHEAQYAQQLSNLARAQIEYDQSQLRYRQQLSDAKLDIELTHSSLERRLPVEKTGVPQAEIDRLTSELAHKRRTNDMLQQARESDQAHAAQNLAQLRASLSRMKDSLELMRSTLDRLTVVAPMNGRLVGFELQVGELVAPGTRIAEIHETDAYKLTAMLDEFYLGRVTVGQTAEARLGDTSIRLVVDKVHSRVENRRFRIELSFPDGTAGTLRTGQTVRSKLILTDASDAVTVPIGDFLEHTGGNSIFVVDEGTAKLRYIRLGRRSAGHVEVLSGLSDGETVIVGGYAGLDGLDRVRVTNSEQNRG